MKKLLRTCVFATALLVAACKPSPFIEGTTDKLTIEAAGGSSTVKFNTNYAWTATSSAAWLTVTPNKGDAGEVNLAVSAQANPDYDPRNATITVTAEGVAKTIAVTQNQKEGFVIETTSFEIGSDGGNITIPVKANITYTCTPDCNWIKVQQLKSLADCQLILSVSPNESYDARTGNVKIAYKNQETNIVVTQSQLNELIVKDKEFEIGSKGGELVVSISSNVSYEATAIEGAGSWITVKKLTTKGLAGSSIGLVIAENKGYDGRVGQVKVAGGGKESIITVTQSQADELIVEKTSFEVGISGGEVKIPFKTNCAYSYKLLGEATWLSIIEENTASTKGLVEYNVKIKVDRNDTGEVRTAQVKIESAGKESVVTLTQTLVNYSNSGLENYKPIDWEW